MWHNLGFEETRDVRAIPLDEVENVIAPIGASKNIPRRK